MRRTLFIFLTFIASFGFTETNSLQSIINETGIQGGLIVHVGCEDGSFETSIDTDDSILVQGLTEDPITAAKAREHIRNKEQNGRVSISYYDGENLPYVESVVNLLIISEPGKLSNQEIMRVLAPNGIVLLRKDKQIPNLKTIAFEKNNEWKIAKKPWPDEIDEWTHYLYDESGSSVSKDSVVGEPKGLRWTCGPFWARSHEHTASMNAMVSAAGRVFYVMDEGPTESIQLPAENYLTARDAFNGIELWKRPLDNWFNHLYPLKSGPGWLPRRLVAVEDRVYLAPGAGENLLCLDAATGEVLHQFEKTKSTFELIVSDGIVFAAIDPDLKPCDYAQEHPNCWKERDRASKLWGWHRDKGTRILKAFDAKTGQLLWEKEMPIVPMTLSADSNRLCIYDGNALFSFDKKTGDELWQTDISDMLQVLTGYAGPRLIICENHVVFAPQKEIFVLDAKTGDVIWTAKDKPRSGHFSLEDFYVIDDKIWVMGRDNNGRFKTYNLADGTVLEDYSNPIDSFYIHQRCYPGKATQKCLFPPIMGTTVYDMKANQWSISHWLRGGCIYGSMPANGMIYSGPHACACYYQSKVNGFNAVAPTAQPAVAPPSKKRLVKGPAYNKVNQAETYPTSAWPVFRHDNIRSGYVKTSVGKDISQAWEKSFQTKLSQAIAANGKVYISAIDEHTLYALDAESGNVIWHFIAGGRVNSPPTLHKGLALFGCADGCIYALDAKNGKLAWKFQAAPNSRQLVSYGQLESVWPIAGSVLVQDNKLYCIAGRSMFLDGGIRMLILNPETGELLYENVMDNKDPESGKPLQEFLMGKHMPVAMPDILSSDSEYIYMKSQTFTKNGRRVRIAPQRPDEQYGQEVHLFAPISFLDDSWHQRTYWIYGRVAGEGWAEFQLPPKRVPYGRIMCVDDSNAYSFGRDPELLCNTSVSEYRLFSAAKYPERKVGIPSLEGRRWPSGRYPTKPERRLAAHTVDWKELAKQPMSKLTALKYNWINEAPEILAKAMVLTNDLLYIAGPRDTADEKRLWGLSNEKEYQQKMHKQVEWLNGKHGCFLQVVSKENGLTQSSYHLDHMPVFDGLIASEGKLYMSTTEGSIICYKPTKK